MNELPSGFLNPNMMLTPECRAQIEGQLFAGSKIAAIKLYRAATNTGLAEAKAAVDHIEQGLRAASPERFQHPPVTAASGGAGCAVFLASIVVCALAVRLSMTETGSAEHSRYELAMTSALLVMMAYQSAAMLQTPRRRALGFALMFVTFFLLAAMIFRIFRS